MPSVLLPLQRIRLDADLGQLVGGTGGRREALDLIALTFGRVANRRERRRLPAPAVPSSAMT